MRRIILAALTVLLLAAPAAQAQTAGFTDSYPGYNTSTGACDVTHRVYGREPADGLRHPVLIYTHGAWGLHNTAEGKKIVDVAADNGWVAASVDWPAGGFWWDETVFAPGNAKCIYGSTGMVPRLCAHAAADCSLGWVVWGFSKGAQIASRARPYGARATNLMGYVTDSGVTGRTDLRITDGEAEGPNRGSLNLRTGQSCASTAFSCLRADGTGWQVVRNSEMTSGTAGHCWMQRDGACTWNEVYEPKWLPPNEFPWSILPTLRWLRGYTG